MRKGVLVIVSGFSGSGKGTVTKELVKRYDSYVLSISATSRHPRPGESEGVDYFYKSREEFESMIREDAFLEYAEYVGNYYGTPKDYVLSCLENGKDVILEIEVQGALQIKEKFPLAVTFFMTPPSAKLLKERLLGRGTESEEVVKKRLIRAAEESELMNKYDYIVINDDLEECILELHALIQSQHCLTSNNIDFIASMKKQLKEI